jgi:predicted phage tail protein
MLPFIIPEKAKALIAKGAFLLICIVAVWGVFQMFQAKNEKIENLTTQYNTKAGELKTMTEKYDAAKLELSKKKDSDQATEDVKVIVKEVVVKQEQAKTQANEYVENKLAAIEAKYKDLEKSAANEERKRVEISLERAKGLWLSYCLQEPQNKACK